MSYRDGELLYEIIMRQRNLVLGVTIDALKNNRASKVIDTYITKDCFVCSALETCSFY